MDQLLIALIGLFGALLGILIGAWRQAALQRSLSQYEDLRRWQQERREVYLRLVVVDDELYRALIRDIRDLPPGRSTDDPNTLGLSGVLLPPLASQQRLDVLNIFDHVWRAKRAIELFHLVDDDLLASVEKLVAVDAELVGLMVFDLNRDPDGVENITARAWELLQERRLRINEFMQHARIALDVPSVDRRKARTGARRESLTQVSTSGRPG
jgi:hypothetical protein